MKQLILNAINDLRLADQMQSCQLKDNLIDDFFKRINDLLTGTLTVIHEKQNTRSVEYRDEKQGFSFFISVTKTEDDYKIIINSNFEEDEED